jgi:multidrug efflux pump subunit AcrA (membrane-fusion protein)
MSDWSLRSSTFSARAMRGGWFLRRENLKARPNYAAMMVAAIIVALAMGGCRSGGGAPNSDNTAAPAASTVKMTVSAVAAVVAPMRREIRLLGTTVATSHLQLRAPAAGRVLGYHLQSGDRVRRGEVVAHILNREVEAAANGLVVAQQVDPAEAPTLAQSVKRYSHGGGIAVIAPEDGIVSQRLVSTGQIVNDMEALADLIDPLSIYVEAAVPIDELALVRPGMDAIVTSPMFPGATMPARVAALAPNLSPNGATSPARIEFTSDARIIEAGAPVEVSVTTASTPDAIVIPAAALFEDAVHNSYYVFVVGADGRAHRTAITIGIRSGSEVQMTSGVKTGDLVITSGGYAVADGLKVTVTTASR